MSISQLRAELRGSWWWYSHSCCLEQPRCSVLPTSGGHQLLHYRQVRNPLEPELPPDLGSRGMGSCRVRVRQQDDAIIIVYVGRQGAHVVASWKLTVPGQPRHDQAHLARLQRVHSSVGLTQSAFFRTFEKALSATRSAARAAYFATLIRCSSANMDRAGRASRRRPG